MSYSLQDLRDMAEAALGGAANEVSFGATNQVPSIDKLTTDHRFMAAAGHMAPYLVPFLGEETALARLAKLGASGTEGLMRLGKGAGEMAAPYLEKQFSPLMAKMGQGAVGANVAGGARSALAGLVNKFAGAAGGEDKGDPVSEWPQDAAQNVGANTFFGAGAGGLASILNRFAPAVYNADAITGDGTAAEKAKAGLPLMKANIWGTPATFMAKAKELMAPFSNYAEKISPQLMDREAGQAGQLGQKGVIDMAPLRQAADTSTGQVGAGAGTTSAMNTRADALRNGLAGLNPETMINPDASSEVTSWRDINNSQKLNNNQIKQVSPAARASVYSGDPSAPQDLANKQAFKGILGQGENQALDKLATPDEAETWRGLKSGPDSTYGQGAQLAGNLDASTPPSMHVGHFWKSALANSALKALPLRTGLGVLMDAPAGGYGAAAGYSQSRFGGSQEPQNPFSDLLLKGTQNQADPFGDLK